MDTSLILCVDGGGSGSRARLADANGKAIAEAAGGPCNPTTDLAAAVAAVSQLWRDTAEQAGVDPAETDHHRLAIGGAGLVMPEARAAFAEALEKLGRDGPPPSERAAEVVLAVIRGAGVRAAV